MDDIYCYAFVEDAPSREVLVRLLEHRNESCDLPLHFVEGFPKVMRGSGNIRKKCSSMRAMAKPSAPVLCLVDLDQAPCPATLISDWFGSQKVEVHVFPSGFAFRIVVREIESWIMADLHGWASYLGISAPNFSTTPDELPDPKQYLLNVIRNKGKKRVHSEMLPQGTAHVGPRYNEVLCDFIKTKWSPTQAAKNSPSLTRAIKALEGL